MIIRKIKPEELKRTTEISSIAFEYGIENEKTSEELVRERESEPKSRGDLHWREHWAAFRDDDKTMMSFFIAIPYPIHFDGQACTMVGVGDVSTLPQYRRAGGIRGCFEHMLSSIYADGAAFSYLYPFSTAYYRKFGYEMACEKMRYKIPLQQIRSHAVAGTCHLLEQGHMMLPAIKQIYEIWQKRYNLMVVNESFEYAWVDKANPPKEQEFTYLYQSKAGVPKAYMTFRKVEEGGERNLLCSRLVFVDAEGFRGLMNLIRTCAGDHEFVSFDLPKDLDISLLLSEWALGGCICQKVFWGMVRVINVEKVLSMARYKGTGTIIMQVKDGHITENNHSFYVEFENGIAKKVEKNQNAPDITLDIGALSRLMIGMDNVEMLPYMPAVQVHTKDREILEQVFYKKPVMILEYF